ncbi:hypothetical protein [Arthrobacter sp. MA-N2]|nr:hypothetical protein [Arthrobacter sp. MA-N2]
MIQQNPTVSIDPVDLDLVMDLAGTGIRGAMFPLGNVSEQGRAVAE